MLRLTDGAAAALKSIRVPEGHALRLVPEQNGGVVLAVEVPRAGDKSVYDGQTEVLRIAAPLAGELVDALMDVDPGVNDNRPHLVVTRPQGSASGGIG